MKKIILLISITLITLSSFGQASLRKGFIATESGDTVSCVYSNGQWRLESDTNFVVVVDTLRFTDGTKIGTASGNTGTFPVVTATDTLNAVGVLMYTKSGIPIMYSPYMLLTGDSVNLTGITINGSEINATGDVIELTTTSTGRQSVIMGSTQGIRVRTGSISNSSYLADLTVDSNSFEFRTHDGGSLETAAIITRDSSNFNNRLNAESLSINGGDVLTSTDTIDLKTAVENESFDNIDIGGYNIRFNESEGVHEFVTGISGVVWQGALEDLVQIYNNTGSTIPNGAPYYFSGSIGDTIATFNYCSANIPQARTCQGLTTMEIPNGSWGFGCRRGKVRGLDCSLLTFMGPVYLSDDSTYTSVKPDYPSDVIVIGGLISDDAADGIINVDVSLGFQRQLKTKSYSFTSLSISSGEYWKAGFYDASTTDANLTQASTSITYGTADISYEAHPFAVYGGVGSVTGGGRVALITTGISYNDATGAQTPADVDTIITDITNAALNVYDETKKYLGTVTYQLVIAEGAPTAYSLDFNYGYAKYDDIGDRDFYLTGIECVWRGDGTDATGFDVELYKHSQTGWTYSAAAFAPGNSILAARSIDQAGFLRVTNNQESAWKRTSIDEFINGDGAEGFLIKVTTGVNSTIQTMDIHIEVALD